MAKTMNWTPDQQKAIDAKKLLEDPTNEHLQKQQMLLPSAQICTIDSYCGNLVRENFEQLGLTPDFRMLDETEVSVLQRAALEEVLEELYAEQDPDFLKLVELLAGTTRPSKKTSCGSTPTREPTPLRITGWRTLWGSTTTPPAPTASSAPLCRSSSTAGPCAGRTPFGFYRRNARRPRFLLTTPSRASGAISRSWIIFLPFWQMKTGTASSLLCRT